MREQEASLRRVAGLLKTSAADVPERVEKLLTERRELEREIEKLRAEQRGAASSDLTERVKEVAGTKVVAARVDSVEGDDLRTMVDELRDKLRSGVVLLASEKKGRVTLALGVTADLTERFRAGDLVREVARVVGGKGGGRPDFAQAGGKDASKLDEAFERLEALIAEG
jgi:alanyl-tRNA synthetase